MVNFDVISLNQSLGGRRAVLSHIATELAKKCGIQSQVILTALSERERLGSTAMGEALAMPHSIIDEISRAYTMLLTLKKGVDFEATDRKLVTIVFALVSPGNHVPILAQAARMFRDSKLKRQILKAQDGETLQEVITQAIS